MKAIIVKEKHYSCGETLKINDSVTIIKKHGMWFVKSGRDNIYLKVEEEDFQLC